MPRERKNYFVYIMSSLSGTLYIGMTSKLRARIFEHKFHRVAGFTDKYNVERLLYCESFDDVHNREKQLKGWRRSKKVALVESMNPHWLDLGREWYPWMEESQAGGDPSTPLAIPVGMASSAQGDSGTFDAIDIPATNRKNR
jgi:putative endonuclease